jgi:hypothetical protein
MDTMKTILVGVIKRLQDYDSNVIDIHIPLDMQKRISTDRDKVIDLLNQALDVIDESRRFITNRAREEMSHESHAAVYQQLNGLVNDHTSLDPKGWAEALLMYTELTELLENNEESGK